jgi:hypothetical protein
VKISTGESESHPTPLPIDSSATPAVAPPTPVFPSGHEQGGSLTNTAGVDFTADAEAAMAAGMSADSDRRGRYGADILPTGSAYGDPMDLPPVPANVLPAADSYGYPYAGMEPTPAAAGFENPAYGD